MCERKTIQNNKCYLLVSIQIWNREKSVPESICAKARANQNRYKNGWFSLTVRWLIIEVWNVREYSMFISFYKYCAKTESQSTQAYEARLNEKKNNLIRTIIMKFAVRKRIQAPVPARPGPALELNLFCIFFCKIELAYDQTIEVLLRLYTENRTNNTKFIIIIFNKIESRWKWNYNLSIGCCWLCYL